jgi:hypothetical protein
MSAQSCRPILNDTKSSEPQDLLSAGDIAQQQSEPEPLWILSGRMKRMKRSKRSRGVNRDPRKEIAS